MKVIQGFPNYKISKNGKIWSKKRKDRMGRPVKGRWLKLITDKDGYLGISLYKNNKVYYRRVHRLVLETYVGACPIGMECRHLDRNYKNNNLDNLCWSSHKENEQDKVKHGTLPIGEKHGMTKLNKQDVRLIFDSY